MKNYLSITLFTILLCCVSTNGKTNSAPLCFNHKEIYEGESNPITLQMLNCKRGLYRTYKDFVNGTPEDLQFVEFKDMVVMGKMQKFTGQFKDANGKKTEVAFDQFWGWKSEKGLFRCMPFTSTSRNITAGAVWVRYVADDYVYYNSEQIGVDFGSGTWLSRDLQSEMLDAAAEGKNLQCHLSKMKDYQADECKIPGGEGLTNFLALASKKYSDCILKTPNLRFVLVTVKGDKNEPYKYIAASK